MRRLFLIPLLVLPALTRDSPLVWGTVPCKGRKHKQGDKERAA